MHLSTLRELCLNTDWEWEALYALLSVVAEEGLEEITDHDDWDNQAELVAQIILKASEAMSGAPEEQKHSIAMSLGLALKNIYEALDVYERNYKVQKIA